MDKQTVNINIEVHDFDLPEYESWAVKKLTMYSYLNNCDWYAMHNTSSGITSIYTRGYRYCGESSGYLYYGERF